MTTLPARQLPIIAIMIHLWLYSLNFVHRRSRSRGTASVHVVKISESGWTTEKICWRAVLDNHAILHDQDAIEIHNRFKAVGDGDDRSALEFGSDDALH